MSRDPQADVRRARGRSGARATIRGTCAHGRMQYGIVHPMTTDGGGSRRRIFAACAPLDGRGCWIGIVGVAFVVRSIARQWDTLRSSIADARIGWLVAGVVRGDRHGADGVAVACGPGAARSAAWKHGRPSATTSPARSGSTYPAVSGQSSGAVELARSGGVPAEVAYASVALSLGALYLAAMVVVVVLLPVWLAGSGTIGRALGARAPAIGMSSPSTRVHSHGSSASPSECWTRPRRADPAVEGVRRTRPPIRAELVLRRHGNVVHREGLRRFGGMDRRGAGRDHVVDRRVRRRPGARRLGCPRSDLRRLGRIAFYGVAATVRDLQPA